jgi:hypothetical protein
VDRIEPVTFWTFKRSYDLNNIAYEHGLNQQELAQVRAYLRGDQTKQEFDALEPKLQAVVNAFGFYELRQDLKKAGK